MFILIINKILFDMIKFCALSTNIACERQLHTSKAERYQAWQQIISNDHNNSHFTSLQLKLKCGQKSLFEIKMQILSA